MKNKLGGHIINEIVGLRVKPYNYLKDNNDEDKRRKRHGKICYIKSPEISRL